MIEDTFPKLLMRNYLAWGDNHVAMRLKRFGIWNEWTWKDEYYKVRQFSLGLVSLGLKPEDKVAILGDNEPETFWASFAVQSAQGIMIGLFADATPSELEYVLNHSDTRFAVVNDQEQVDKLLQIKKDLPQIKKVIWWDPKGLRNYHDPWLMSFKQVLDLGKDYEKEREGIFEEMIEKGNSRDVCGIFYTSGTTGLPKGAMLTFNSVLNSVRGLLWISPMDSDDNTISYLPPAWFAEPLLGSVNHLVSGLKLNFCEEPETVMEDLREISPACLLWGPRQWENIASLIQVKMRDAFILKRLVYRLFLPLGYHWSKLQATEQRNPPLFLFWKLLHSIGDSLVFRPIRDKIGLVKTRVAFTGGYTLGADTMKFIRALGINLRQVYGSTEAGLVCAHKGGEVNADSVGIVLPGVEFKISSEGEALIKGPSIFQGYYKNPEATRNALQDGWYCSGDAMHVDEKGQVHFIDRIKEMGELQGGVRYSPQYMESQLRFGAYIKDAMVTGGKERGFVGAIINIDFESVSKWAEAHRVPYTTFVDLSQKDEVARLVLDDIERVNRTIPRDTQIRKFVLLHKEFDPDEAELTRSRKLRRDFVEKKYANLIDAIYSDKQKVGVKATVSYSNGRTGVVKTEIKIRRMEG